MSKIELKPCPFCGADITIRHGLDNITFFQCTNQECRSLVSFGGSKEIKRGIVEAQDPVKNFNRRADNG